MTRNWGRRMVGTLSAMALLVTAAACSGEPTPSASPEGTPTVSETFNPQAWSGSTVRLLRHSGYDADVMRQLFEGFTAETGIKVEMDEVPFANLRTKEVTELSTGLSTYDLMATPDYWLPEYTSASWVRALDDLIASPATLDPDFDIADISERLIGANVIEGATYALPWKFNTAVLAYRTDVFPEAPTDHATWLAGASAAQAAGLNLVGMSLGAANAPEFFLDLVIANGGSFLNEDATKAAFNTPEGLEAMEFLVELAGHSADGAVNRAWDESAQLMASGVTASEVVLSSVASNANTGQAEGKVGYAPLPPTATTATFMNTWGLLIPQSSQNPEAAFLLMQYLLSRDAVLQMAEGGGGSVVPARVSLLDELAGTFPSFPAQKTAAENGVIWPRTTKLDAARTALSTFVQEAALGTKTPAEALAAGEQAVNDALAG